MISDQARIFILDDEERIRQLIVDFLEDYEDFSLRAMATAEESLVELARESADLCIVDLRLPGMSGLDFIRQALDLGLCCRFVLHTGSVDFILPENMLQLGLTDKDIFRKPCNTADILARMRERLAR